jgi:DNA polymerase-1
MGNGIEIWVYRSFSKIQIERPEQVIDFLGMMGDAADNIPDCLVWEKSPLRNS